MKKLFLSFIFLILLSSCGTDETNQNIDIAVDKTSIEVTKQDRNQEIISLQPDYKAELYGKIKSLEGNIFTISEIDTSKDPTIEMTQEEKQLYMQGLDEADRTALKDQIQSAVLGDVKVMIPVGIPMIKKELVGEDKVDLEASLEDLKSGDIVSIWYDENINDRKVAKYVKRSMRK